uniref:Glucuronosyltransferase n=1 Tax=Panagrellus redivivus TaxID=6233 RepID=A0A7E4ZYD4_PANRE
MVQSKKLNSWILNVSAHTVWIGLFLLVPECDSNLRPDIALINETAKLLNIIDVTIPFENGPEAFKKAREAKKEKYKGIETHFKKTGYKTFNDAFIIGSLGAYDRANKAFIRRLGIPHKYAVLMNLWGTAPFDDVVSDVIKRSHDLYVEHVTDIRQYRADP